MTEVDQHERPDDSAYTVVVHYPRDQGILQRCGEEIISNISCARDHGDGDLDYFIDYPLYKKSKRLSVALFTHSEGRGRRSCPLKSVARSVDYCVATCERTADILKNEIEIPAERVSVIHMGVPERRSLRFGVAGHRYEKKRESGRLAEAMVKEGFDVLAWDKGWPCQVWTGDRDSFYQRIDYLVVTAVDEGGSVPLLEALARGVPVIAPDVGWCWEYSVLRYARGKQDSLVKVMRGLVPRLWEDWARDHRRLFDRLLRPRAQYTDGRSSSTDLAKGPAPLVEIIVVKYGCPDLERECIDSVARHTHVAHRLTVIDNYGPDEPLAVVWNRVIRSSRATYICLLNNDTRVEEHWLEKLLEVFKSRPAAGIVGPITNHASGIQGKHAKAKPYALREAKMLVGFCMVFPKDLWAEVGGFDERYELYGEDSDFCKAILANRRRLYVREDVFVFHHGKQGTPVAKQRGKDVAAIWDRSRNLFKKKWRHRPASKKSRARKRGRRRR